MIQVRNLHKQFGSQVVLQDVSLDIPDDQTLAIVGPSGAGKSVLLKIITGLLDADSGEVLIDGESMTHAKSSRDKTELSRKLGVLFQGAALLDSLTLYENLVFPLEVHGGYGKKEIESRALRLLDEVGLLGQEHLMPGEVSIGVRKRLGIARALITNPKTILFDEPNTGLDPKTGQEIYDLIGQVQKAEGFSGIVISHEIPEVFQICDQVAMLYNGRLEAVGPVASFMRSDNPIVAQFVTGAVEGPMISY